MPVSRAMARRKAAWIAVAGLSAALIILFRRALIQAALLCLGAVLTAFIAEPLCRLLERRLSRNAAALCSLGAIVFALIGAAWALLPAMLKQLVDLTQALPEIMEMISDWIARASRFLAQRVPGFSLSAAGLSGVESMLSDIAARIVGAAADVAGIFARISLTMVLSYFFLRDRDRLLLRLELVFPRSIRHAAVGLGNCVGRELRLYLRGQLMIALAVATLAAAGLALIRVRGALILGPFIGLLNMIPYFGPYIGGVPAVLMALGDGWKKALMALAVLSAVQQIDGSFLSPRILGSLTGLSPALVLVGIFTGARLAGIPGMLLAVPSMMFFRTLYRFSVQRTEKSDENI